MAKKSGLGKFLAGAAIGVGLGVLFAPKSGAETRKELKEKLDDLIVKVKELDVKEVRDSISKKIEDIKYELADLDKEKALNIAKEKAEVIKEKVEDLYKEAKEKATPIVQKAVADLKIKTASVLKDVVKKLEEKENKEVKAK